MNSSDIPAAEKVHWFRTRAEMMRWVEEVEILGQEFRRFVEGAQRMEEFWGGVPSKDFDHLYLNKHDVHHLAGGISLGEVVYARQKSSMYKRMATDARHAFLKLGGSWPESNESVDEHVSRLRPSLDINWTSSNDDCD